MPIGLLLVAVGLVGGCASLPEESCAHGPRSGGLPRNLRIGGRCHITHANLDVVCNGQNPGDAHGGLFGQMPLQL
jgi:hypothetical protein